MTPWRNGWMVWLLLAATAPSLAQREAVDGLTILVLGSTAVLKPETPAAYATALATAAGGRLAHKLDARPGPEGSAGWLDDLRRLPGQVARYATGVDLDGRYVVCFRLLAGDAGEVLSETALVDTLREQLLAFRTTTWEVAPTAAEMARVAVDLALEAAPLKARPVTVAAVTAAVAQASAPTQATAGEHAASGAGLLPLRPALRRPEPRPVKAPTTVKPVALTAEDARRVLESFAGRALTLGGLGEATERPHVVEDRHRLLLLPDSQDPEAAPLVVLLSVYGVGEATTLELRFSQPVALVDGGRTGAWHVADLAGFRPDVEVMLPVARSGLLSLHVKPGPGGGTRLGFQCTAAGEVDLRPAADGSALTVAVDKSAARVRPAEPALGARPWGGLYTAVRSQRGTASWYGARWQGRRTASGERFNMHGWTAAHKTLPLGSFVQVTNLRNGLAVVLRINDRGPFIPGRIIDVSAAAAKALGFLSSGTAPVRVDLLKPAG